MCVCVCVTERERERETVGITANHTSVTYISSYGFGLFHSLKGVGSHNNTTSHVISIL